MLPVRLGGVRKLLWMVALAAPLAAQGPERDAFGDDARPALPTITFTFELPGSIPSRYAVVVESSGRARYRSDAPLDEAVHGGASNAAARDTAEFTTDFTVSEAARERVFKLAEQLRYFQGNWNYDKGRIANMGRKTLTYADSGRRHQTTYNWSQNPQVEELTRLFQGLSNTLEFRRRLEVQYRFDKLGLDGVLKQMEQAAKDNSLMELQVAEAVLRRIAADRSVMHVARLRAERLLARMAESGLGEDRQNK